MLGNLLKFAGSALLVVVGPIVKPIPLSVIVVVIDPPDADAVIHAESGDLVGARRLWRLLLMEAPDYAPARRNLAMLDHADTLIAPAAQPPSNVLSIPAGHSLSISRRVDATRAGQN